MLFLRQLRGAALSFALGTTPYPEAPDAQTADVSAFVPMLEWFSRTVAKHRDELAAIAAEEVRLRGRLTDPFTPAQVFDRLIWFESVGYRNFKKGKLIENGLEDAVSCFDGFGREHCSTQPFKISFQSITSAQQKLLTDAGIDISAGVAPGQWAFVCEQFQKRHLLAHKMGIIDAEFVSKTGCSPAMIGRKVGVSEGDVRTLVSVLRSIADTLFRGLPRH